MFMLLNILLLFLSLGLCVSNRTGYGPRTESTAAQRTHEDGGGYTRSHGRPAQLHGQQDEGQGIPFSFLHSTC